MLLIGSLARQVVNINLFKKLITLKSNLRIVAKSFYEVRIAKKPIFITSLANSFSNSILSTLSALFLSILL